MAAVVSVKDLDRIGEPKEQRGKGLLAAIGAWEEFDDLEKMVVKIYKGRGKAKERGIGRFDCHWG